ncbi:hypothetical protein WD347_002989 [Vibrio parahaemolyticus]|uniref:hypothetical protein n=1 Tax=Vibrio parahaemolyticus TaxID=670 RepID=UPI00038E552A|nr:hypothetical protein [Vibrio parahaemolyticus]EJG0922057.1 hypothetical protein [Vibrio parahaemolyticus O1:K68]EJG0931603.1 hypothetical protein [Vibrio parahaemolyticus O1]EJG0945884.1 hypothetical protein [Vibrio parahaemolyticus O10]EQM49487.1 hypothetical protein D051_3935 [Vibrio parahaemolyticus VPCR-2010]EGQ9063786.1 hypothetical protein [Vibrio parahaemolyticus]
MANVIGSFNEGVRSGAGLVDLYNRQQDRERQKVLQQREDIQFERGIKEQDLRMKRLESELAWLDKSRKQAEVNWDREAQIFKQQQEEYNHKKTLMEREEGLKNIFLPAIDKAIVSGDFSLMETPEFTEYVAKNPQFDLNNILGSNTGKALGEAATLFNKMAQGEMPAENDPMLINAVETLMPEITKAKGLPTIYTDKDGKQHQIVERKVSSVQIIQGGGAVIEQDLTLDNGKTVTVPVTQNRTSKPDDNILVVPLSEFSNRMKTIIDTRQHLNREELNNWRQLQTGRSLNFDENGNVVSGGRSSRSSSSGPSSSMTQLAKQQLSEQNGINSKYDEQIAKLDRSMFGNEEDYLNEIDRLNRERERALDRHTMMYLSLTGYDPQGLAREQAQSKVRERTQEFVESYPGYEFSEYARSKIQTDLLKNPTAKPSEINETIQGMIKEGKHVTKIPPNETLISKSQEFVDDEKKAAGQKMEEPSRRGKLESLREKIINSDGTYQEKLAAIKAANLSPEDQRQAMDWLNYSGFYNAADKLTSNARDNLKTQTQRVEEQRKNASPVARYMALGLGDL